MFGKPWPLRCIGMTQMPDKPEITDETDCPFVVLAVVYPGIAPDSVGKPSYEPPICPQDRFSPSGA